MKHRALTNIGRRIHCSLWRCMTRRVWWAVPPASRQLPLRPAGFERKPIHLTGTLGEPLRIAPGVARFAHAMQNGAVRGDRATPPAPCLTLLTLGRLGLEAHDGRMLLGPGKPYALLVYAALAPNRTTRRDELLDLLWSNVSPDRGRAVLRQTLFQLRALLGDDRLTASGQAIHIVDSVVADVDAFRDAIARDHLERAVELYHGPFLSEFALAGAHHFEEWATAERTRLDRLYRRAAESLVRQHLDAGRFVEAKERAKVLRDTAPLNESAWRLLLEAHQAAGELSSARLEAASLLELLRSEKVQPEPATLARLELLESSVASDAWSSDETSPLSVETVGRSREFAILVEQWRALRRGSLRCVQIVGEPGMGKSRLLGDFAQRLSALGAACVRVRAHPGEQRLAFSLLSDLAESISKLPGALGVSPASAALLVDLNPMLAAMFNVHVAQTTPWRDEKHRRRGLAFADLLNAVADERPFALLVDDLHWADEDSLLALTAAIHRSSSPILIVTASRRAESVESTPNVMHLVLAGLDEEGVKAVVHGCGVELSDSDLEHVAHALCLTTDGCPFLVLQSLELALERGLLVRQRETFLCPDIGDLVTHCQSGGALSRRIMALGADAATLLRLLAAAGFPLAAPVLSQCTRLSIMRTDEVLRELATRSLVSENNGRWEAAHDSIAEAVQRDLDEAERRTLQVTLAGAIERATSPNESLQASALLLVRAEARRELEQLFQRHVVQLRRAGDRRPLSALAMELIGSAASRADVSRLIASLPMRVRIPPIARTIAIAAAGLALAGFGVTRLAEPSHHLYVVQAPTMTERLVDTHEFALLPAPVVELRGPDERLSDAANDSVVLSIERGEGELHGRLAEPIVRGRAVFANATLVSRGPVLLEFRSLRTKAIVRVPYRPADSVAARPLHLVDAHFGDLHLTSWQELVVSPGEHVSGFVTVDYTTTAPDATVWYAGTPTWGPPDSVFHSFGSLSTPVVDRRRIDPVSFDAPRTPGRYAYLLVWGIEPNAHYLLSATNWVLGAPRWRDGNDVAATPAESLEVARRTGWLRPRILRRDEGRLHYSPQPVAIDGFRVVVR